MPVLKVQSDKPVLQELKDLPVPPALLELLGRKVLKA
jgi:hypothetical protein